MEIKTQLRKLWDLCFNETQVFSDLYFEMRDIEQSSIYIKHNQHIVSAMQLLPYSLTFHGTSFDTAYISNACTHLDRSMLHENNIIAALGYQLRIVGDNKLRGHGPLPAPVRRLRRRRRR